MRPDCVLELPSDVGTIERAVDELLLRCREAEFNCDRLELNLRVGVAEALANAMRYGNGGESDARVRLEADFTPRAATIRVTDQGGGFDPSDVPDPTLPEHRERSGGRGIFLIRKLMDRVEFNERGNSVTMFLSADSRPASERELES